MVGTAEQRAEVAERLKKLIKPIEELMELVKDDRQLDASLKQQAQEKMKAIKEALKAESRAPADPNSAEQAFYYPVVFEASTRIRVRWNSPPGPQWRTELYSARLDLRHYLDQLLRSEQDRT